jgi:hypothetical protein
MGISAGNDIEITGATDGTNIGNVGDRLKVNVDAFPFIPLQKTRPFSQNLLNGSSADMAINGATVNQTFSFSPTGTVFITQLGIVMSDDNIKKRDRFGDVNVTNGVIIETIVSSVTTELVNMIVNGELAEFFITEPYDGNSLMQDKPTVIGKYNFNPPLELRQADGDLIRCRIRDNLTGLQWLTMRVSGWQVV